MMPSGRPTRALKAAVSSRARRCCLTLAVAVLVSFAVAGVAYASTVFFYYHDFANPGVPHSSPGWNWRDYNRVCRDDPTYQSYGIVRAVNYYSDGSIEADTGHVLTSCQNGVIARIEDYGYWLTRCWNSDVVGMILLCQTTKP
jgi:hypothetical protein